ncbi:MAG: type II secretion system minor pseudopilin GspH [Gammaproteobacteria bacterium]|nr:type II secretion system minor pseudopilin GspH [Gammaproteobacteria bacterium]
MRTFASQTCKGFSLLELLVVIAIVGILTGTVILGFTGADLEQYLKGEADRFAIRVELARQHALQRNREWGIYVEEGGYRFAEFDPVQGRWFEKNQRPFTPVSPFETITLRVETEGDTLPTTNDEDLPQIIVFSSGEITPFNLYFEPGWDSTRWVVQSDGLSSATAERDNGGV